jgi:hypothetical protein
MNRSSILKMAAPCLASISLLLVSCAGELSEAEKDLFSRFDAAGGTGGAGGSDPSGTGGNGTGGNGTGGATGGTGGATGGAGGTAGAGGAPMLDPCMAPLMRDRCSLSGCHGGTILSAGLDLSPAIIAQPSVLVDKANVGEATGCKANTGKIIDRQRPEQSMLYQKVSTPTCGARMPPSVAFAPSEIACVLNWIKSIPGVSGGTGGAGGAGGTGGASGAGGAVDGGRG